jgi:hypothetical protein
MTDKRRSVWYRFCPVGTPDVVPGNSALGFDLVVYGGSNALFAAEYGPVVLKVNSAC